MQVPSGCRATTWSSKILSYNALGAVLAIARDPSPAVRRFL
jgi:hypothetical protein